MRASAFAEPNSGEQTRQQRRLEQRHHHRRACLRELAEAAEHSRRWKLARAAAIHELLRCLVRRGLAELDDEIGCCGGPFGVGCGVARSTSKSPARAARRPEGCALAAPHERHPPRRVESGNL